MRNVALFKVNKPNNEIHEVLLTAQEACSYLGLSNHKFKHYCSNMKIFPVKKDRSNMYLKEDIDSILIKVMMEALLNNIKILGIHDVYCEELRNFENEQQDTLSQKFSQPDKHTFNRLYKKAFNKFAHRLNNKDRFPCIE